MPKQILTSNKRDFIESRKDGGSIVLTNPRTGQTIALPKDATPNELRLARQSLQEQTDTPALLKMPANKAFDLLSGAPASAEVADPEPRRLAEGVGSPNSPYRLRQEKLWAEWKQRQDAKAARSRELETQDRLIDKLADKLAAQKPEQPEQPEPAADDGSQYLPPGLRGSFEDFKASAEANANE